MDYMLVGFPFVAVCFGLLWLSGWIYRRLRLAWLRRHRRRRRGDRPCPESSRKHPRLLSGGTH